MEKELMSMNAEDFLNDYKAGRRDFNGIDFDSIKITGADLTDSKFTSCRFNNVVMAGTKFNSCEFTDVIFDLCNSINASYTDAKFTRCHFTMNNAFLTCDFFGSVFDSTLMQCNYKESFFVKAHFFNCICLTSEFSAALFGFNVIKCTKFIATKFEGIKIMQACEIDDESVMESINEIQKAIVSAQQKDEENKDLEATKYLNARFISTMRFFRSLGVDKALLELRSNGVSEQTGSKTVFISYNRKDEEFASNIRTQLEAGGIRCWFAPLDMQGGGGVREQIEEAIKKQGKVVLILSENSICSTWVSFEVECALAEEKEKSCGVLFPIRICDYEKLSGWEARHSITGDNIAPDVLDRFVPDFTEWQNYNEFGEKVAKLVVAINDSRLLN